MYISCELENVAMIEMSYIDRSSIAPIKRALCPIVHPEVNTNSQICWIYFVIRVYVAYRLVFHFEFSILSTMTKSMMRDIISIDPLNP